MEATVRYEIHVMEQQHQHQHQEEAEGSRKRRAGEREGLEKIRRECLEIAAMETGGYLWHDEGFMLELEKEKEDDGEYEFLTGETRFGECVVDEWVVVFILREITKRIKGTNVTVVDGDGQFLLIEAAECIPRWLDPDTSPNRVFIREGKLFLVGREVFPILSEEEQEQEGKEGHPKSPREALQLMAGQKTAWYPMSSPVQIEAFRNIQGFPGAAFASNSHFAHAVIPLRLALAFQADPQIVPKLAVRASSGEIPPPRASEASTKGDQLVVSKIRFTQCSFAMLKMSLPATKSLPKAGATLVLFPDLNASFKSELIPEKTWQLGEALLKGFQIMCEESEGEEARAWKKYCQSLEKRGYFNVSDESEKASRTEKARTKFEADFCRSQNYFHRRFNESIWPELGNIKEGQMRSIIDDDESWMELDDDLVDDMLKKDDGLHPKTQQDVEKIVSDMQKFVESSSSAFPLDKEGDDAETNIEPISFNLDKFLNILQGLDGTKAVSEEDDDDDESEIDEQQEATNGEEMGEEEEEEEEESEEVVAQMIHDELDGTTLSDIISPPSKMNAPLNDNNNDDDEGDKPVVVDMAVVKGFVDSLSAATESGEESTTAIASLLWSR